MLTGCAAIQVKLGSRVYLAKTPVASIAATLPKGPPLRPAKSRLWSLWSLSLMARYFRRKARAAGKVLWKDLQVKADVVAVNQKGVLSLDKDPRVTEGKVGHVVITAPSHPDVHAELDIPLRYDYAYNANFNGTPGSSGLNGSDGTDGSSGMPGSLDPDIPRRVAMDRMEPTERTARMAAGAAMLQRCSSRWRSDQGTCLFFKSAYQPRDAKGFT